MSTMASQITSPTIVYPSVYSGSDQRKHQSSASLALWGEFTGDLWIPRTKDQYRGRCFHLMTSLFPGVEQDNRRHHKAVHLTNDISPVSRRYHSCTKSNIHRFSSELHDSVIVLRRTQTLKFKWLTKARYSEPFIKYRTIPTENPLPQQSYSAVDSQWWEWTTCTCTVSFCNCIWSIHWSPVLRREWRSNWNSDDRQCSKYIWVINNFIAY